MANEADYTKGNRFYDLEEISAMPKIRIFGNAVLSLMNKFSSGYWNLFDPTNGYTAIHASVAKLLPAKKISKIQAARQAKITRPRPIKAALPGAIIGWIMNVRFFKRKC